LNWTCYDKEVLSRYLNIERIIIYLVGKELGQEGINVGKREIVGWIGFW